MATNLYYACASSLEFFALILIQTDAKQVVSTKSAIKVWKAVERRGKENQEKIE